MIRTLLVLVFFLFLFSYTGSNLSRVQTESILDMKDDINWLLRDEIVFSLCHAPSINLSMLESVTQHIQESQTLELKSSRFSSIRLDFVLDAEQSLETFVKELDKIRIGGCQLSNLGNYYYLRLSSSTSLHVLPRSLLELNTMDPLSTGNEELSKAESEVNEDDSLVDFTAGFSSDSHSASHAEEEMKMHVVRSSMGYHSQSRDSFSELWLILKKTESDVLDVFFHTRYGNGEL